MPDEPSLEDNIENPFIETQEDKTGGEIVIAPQNVSGEIDKMLSQVLNLSKDLVLHEPTCPLCASPHREEIEELWIKEKNIGKIKSLIKEKTGKAVGYDIIDNHMSQHLTKGVREIQKIEYIDRIKRLHNQSLSTLDRISMGFAMIIERLMGVNSITADGEESVASIEKIKSAETSRLMTVFNSLLKLQATILGEMKQSGELITIPSSQFVNIFNEAILEANTDREKQIIKNILDKLARTSQKSQ